MKLLTMNIVIILLGHFFSHCFTTNHEHLSPNRKYVLLVVHYYNRIFFLLLLAAHYFSNIAELCLDLIAAPCMCLTLHVSRVE